MKSKLLLLVASNFGALSPNLQKEIYQEYYKLFYGSIAFMVRDHSFTEDILQESFLKVVNNIPVIDSENKLKAWIKVVVKNTTFNFMRKNKKYRNEIDSESVYINNDINFATDPGFTENLIELKLMSEAIRKCLNELRPDFQVLIDLRWKRQLSYKEIAMELDITEVVVKTKLHRAREAIRKRFKKEWGDIK